MKWQSLVVTLLSVGLAVFVVLHVGIGAVASAALRIGWGGFGLLCASGLALFLVLASAWSVLIPKSSWWALLWGRMVRDSAAEVLPLTQFGGFVAGARAAIVSGVSPALTAGSMAVDVTTEIFAQIAYVALGLLVLLARAPGSVLVDSILKAGALGTVLLLIGGSLFLFLQRHSVWLTERIASQRFPNGTARMDGVVATLHSIHRAPGRLVLSTAIHFVGWIAAAAATWFVLLLIGAKIDLLGVLAIESIVYGARSAAVIISNALGVQEGTYAILAPLVGLPVEMAVALSLLKRARDIAIGIPVLLAWEAAEGHRLFGSEQRKISGLDELR
jgi:glycosyltransferase 2 family protein